MSIDIERCKICIACLERRMFADSYMGDTSWWFRHVAKKAAGEVEKMIRENRTWRNPYALILDYTPGNKLCRHCDYVLEHFVVSNGKIKTHEC